MMPVGWGGGGRLVRGQKPATKPRRLTNSRPLPKSVGRQKVARPRSTMVVKVFGSWYEV